MMAFTVKELKEKFDSFLRTPNKPSIVRKTIENCNPKHVVILCTNLSNARGPSYLQLALENCHDWSDKEKCVDLRTLLIKNSLQNMAESSNLEEDEHQKVVDILLAELNAATDLPPRNFATLIECCINVIESRQRALNPFLLSVFSKLISICSGLSNMVVTSDDPGNIVDGKLWRNNLIRKLCIDNWREEDVTAIIKMFCDVPDLGGDEMYMIVEKACTMISKINSTSEENVPPLLFQVLHLTKAYHQIQISGNHNNFTVFGRIIETLSRYYNKNHERILNQAQEGILESADFIEDGTSNYALQRSECNVIFHLTHAVKMGHPIGKEILKLLKSSIQLSDVLFANPFNMFVGLAITTIKPHQVMATDCIKTAAYKNIQLQLKRDESAWFRQTVPPVTDSQKLFSHLIEQSTTFGGWNMIETGLIDVSMGLLDMSCSFSVNKKNVSKILCGQGHEIIRLVTRKRSSSIIRVLTELTRRILASKGAPQYTNCLQVTIKGGLAVIMEEPPTFINELLDHLGSLGASGAKRVIVALIPLIKYGSPSIKNSIILVLRKCLFMPNLDTRKIAVVGVLQLLKYFKITSQLPLTQMIMSQSSSCLSQAVVSVHQGGTTNNEALCLELMGVIKRSLSQQAIVKMTLYQGLHDVVGRNPEICVAVLDMLYAHAVQLKITSEDESNPIDVDSMIALKSDDVFIIEPVGWFLHCVQLMVGKANHIYGDGNMAHDDLDTSSLVKLTSLLDRLGNIYADKLDCMDLNFGNGADYSKATSSGKYNILKVETYKNIYESLMDYTIMRGAGTQGNKAGLLTRLQYRHTEICELIGKKPLTAKEKTTNKGKDKNIKSKAKDIETLLKSSCTQEVNSDATQNRHENGSKNQFNPSPSHAFSLKGISNILHSILNDNTPSNHAAVSQLRDNAKLATFFLKVTYEKQNQLDKILKISGDGDANDVILKHFSTITATLAESCLTNPEADDRFLPETLQCFLESLRIVSSHFCRNDAAIDGFYGYIHSHARGFSKNTKIKSSQILLEIVDKLINKISSLLERNLSQNEDDMEDNLKKNTIDRYVELLIFLCKEIDVTEANGEETAKNATQWVKNVIEECMITKADTVKLILELFYTCYLRTKSSDTTIIKELAQEIHSKIGDVENLDIENPEKFTFITSETGETVFHQTANYLEYLLESADCIISRCKQIALNKDSGIHTTDKTSG